jgi:hypothetical protein
VLEKCNPQQNTNAGSGTLGASRKSFPSNTMIHTLVRIQEKKERYLNIEK